MNRKNYSFVTMDSEMFKRYEQYCKRNEEPLNYTPMGHGLFGVMIVVGWEDNEKEVMKIES